MIATCLFNHSLPRPSFASVHVPSERSFLTGVIPPIFFVKKSLSLLVWRDVLPTLFSPFLGHNVYPSSRILLPVPY
jgi:hypothetical protein